MCHRLGNFVCAVAAVLVLTVQNSKAQTWAIQVTDAVTHLSAVQFIDDNLGYTAGAFGVILKTTTSGAQWYEVTSGTGLSYSDLYFLNANIGWVVGESGVIVKTMDGGATWTRQISGTTSWLNSVRFFDANNGWVAGANGTALKTTNGGATWTTSTTGTTSTIHSGCYSTSSTGWLATQAGAILKSVDAASSWNMQMIAGPTVLNSVHFVSPNIGWVVGNGGKIAKTIDGGATWVDQPSGTTSNLNALAFATADTGWVVGDNGVIRVTFNGGATWTNQANPLPENLRSAYFTNARHGWAVGLNSAILEYAIVHALPIQLGSFTATAINNAIRLDWTTISEVNNFGFFVERKLASENIWSEVPNSFIAGYGTTNLPQYYSFTDQVATSGRWMYRLRQHDLDGSINYTEPVIIDILTDVRLTDMPVEFSLKQNYPNPFNPTTQIEFSLSHAGFVSLKVFDMLGKQIATIVNEEMKAGSYTKTFNAAGLSSGVYLYKLTAGNFAATKKLIVSK